MAHDLSRVAIRGLSTWLAILCVIAICAGAWAQAEGPAAMTIVQDGEPRARIVTAPDAHDFVKEAAKELQLYIRKMSGATLPITRSARASGNLILVGRSAEVDKLVAGLDEMDLGPDGIVMRSLPGKLILTGRSDGYLSKAHGRTDCGTPNAVYTLLRTLGCRWYMPGDDGEVVPRRTTITVPAMDVVRKPDVSGRWISAGAAWHMGGQVREDMGKWLIRNRVSANTYHQGHGMYTILPKAEHAEAHPEYFALVDGKRRTDAAAQFCMSNADVLGITVTMLTGYFTKQGPWRSYPIGAYDSWLWCECEPCRALYGDKTFSGTTAKDVRVTVIPAGEEGVPNVANAALKFTNAVAEQMEKVDPNCLITYYALYNIPGFPEVRPRDNVMPGMCHLAPHDKAWRETVEKWEAISTHLYYYTYMGHRNAYPKLDIADDIRWAHQHKGTAIFFEHDEYSPVNMLPLYLAAQTMWDTKVDSRKELREFYKDFYGAAERPVRSFWQTFHAMTRPAARDYDCHYGYPNMLTPRVATKFARDLTEGLKLAKEPAVKRRIETLIAYWRIAELQVSAQKALATWRGKKTVPNQNVAKKAIDETVQYINSLKGTFNLAPRLGLLRGWSRELVEQQPKPKMYGGEDPLLPGV